MLCWHLGLWISGACRFDGLCLELLMLLLQEWLQGKVRGLVLGFKEAGLETLVTQGV